MPGSPAADGSVRFQSTRPARGGTIPQGRPILLPLDFNPPAPRGAGRARDPRDPHRSRISIHPPREGRDVAALSALFGAASISIHPPREGRDCPLQLEGEKGQGISIHPPREGRDPGVKGPRAVARISIHPPREGRDMAAASEAAKYATFQSTRPARGGTQATRGRDGKAQGIFQSTRPARGGTPPARKDPQETKDFNPPAPRGAGRAMYVTPSSANLFQSTRPARGGTTAQGSRRGETTYFNPPAPRGAGQGDMREPPAGRNFNPPAPRGAGQPATYYRFFAAGFQSTRPARGGTLRGAHGPRHHHFNPPAPRGAGRPKQQRTDQPSSISIHPPREGRD